MSIYRNKQKVRLVLEVEDEGLNPPYVPRREPGVY
jgi:hypothetical protein